MPWVSAHSGHRFPAPSSKLCQNWLRHWRGTLYLHAAVHQCGQRPVKILGTNKTVEATWCQSTHVNVRRICPGKKNQKNLSSNNFGFIYADVSNVVNYKRNVWYNLSCCIVQELCESRGGRPGLSVLMSLLVSMDVKIYWTMLQHWSQLVLNMSVDVWGH